ncbi:MAG: MraY family glycosyltransferase [Clostridiales bacterium]|nr:MraY family glycosyltransferase [Clostridiales bacterium]
MIYEYIISFFLAFVTAFCATPIARRLAFKVGAVDIPKDARRMHDRPTALLGGLAIVSGFLLSVLFNIITSANIITADKKLAGLLAGIVVILVMGVLDDIHTMNAKLKLAFQIVAAILVVLISDTRILSITNPFSALGYSELPLIISYPLTIIWIIAITNAINLIDGLDGLAAGVASISSLSLFFVSLLSFNIDIYTSLLTAALAGASLGFLPFNYNPAKIFMGEPGTAFLGFTLGVISIQGVLKSYAAISIAIPILILGLPLFDTVFAIIRRVARGKSIFEADRGHLHHRLIDMGFSHRQSVVAMYVASAILGLCAVVLADRGAVAAIILLISLSVFVIGGARYMSDFIQDGKKVYPSENNSADGSQLSDQLSEPSGISADNLSGNASDNRSGNQA